MKIHYAFLAGCCAATAGAFGKLAGLSELENFLILRIICFGAMILCNAGVWTLFVKALHQSNTSLVATVVSSSSNYCCSAVLGFVLFKEVTSLYWWIGMSFIIFGLILTLSENDKTDIKKD